MSMRAIRAGTIAAVLVLAVSGCAVQRGQESVGGYVDDTSITAQVKSRFVSDKNVDASSISVETLKGVVMLSGFAKDDTEKATAESLALKVNGVKSVTNQIVVKP